jgi:hypothetical protein
MSPTEGLPSLSGINAGLSAQTCYRIGASDRLRAVALNVRADGPLIDSNAAAIALALRSPKILAGQIQTDAHDENVPKSSRHATQQPGA